MSNSLERIHTSDPAPESAVDRTVPEYPPAQVQDEYNYFAHNPEPKYLGEMQGKVKEFVKFHGGKRRIALVTSGGTTVPLENNTVRFIDNFSAGTRGATSTEYLIENGYAVIFLHRQFSLLPYSRHYSHTTNCFLDYLDEDNGSVVVDQKYQEQMLQVLRKYRKAKKQNLMLFVPFTTVNQYLFTLRMISLELHSVRSTTLFYLAAAVSDFFLPSSKVSEHKIQSYGGGGKLVVDLDPVPKFLKRLVEHWVPGGMIVSFKLETDANILVSKAKGALERYSHQLVIGNLLQTRKQKVIFVTEDDVKEYSITPEQDANGVELESIIIPAVVQLHDQWIESGHGDQDAQQLED